MEPVKKMPDPAAVAHADMSWVGSIVSPLLNVVGAFALAAVGYVHVRLNKVEADADAVAASLRATVEASAKSVKEDLSRQLADVKGNHEREERVLWEALEADRRRSQDFRETVLREMATRPDIAAMKADLKDHITHVVAGAANGHALTRVG